jgi:hypothetical protein
MQVLCLGRAGEVLAASIDDEGVDFRHVGVERKSLPRKEFIGKYREPISKKFLSAILPFWKPVSVEGHVKKLSLFEGLGPSLTILAPRNGNAKMANQKRKKVF